MPKYKKMNLLLDLFSYKLFKCQRSKCNKKFRCKFYHDNKDRRRCIINHKYYSRICLNKENCKRKSTCKFSHNNFELWYHPNFYKTNFCMIHLNDNKCKYGDYCCNAHNEKELRIEIIHYLKQDYNFFIYKFKTVFCPLKNSLHKKDMCVYAHNYQDFRRLPLKSAKNRKCQKWPNDIIPDIYDKFCKFECLDFHGWKEYEYHFLNYKRIKCNYSYTNCKYNLWCPKIHLDYEKQLLNFFNFIDNNMFIIAQLNISNR